MASAKFICKSKTGIETFSVVLEPDPEFVTPACPVCGRTSHRDYCLGGTGNPGDLPAHDQVTLDDGDTSFFKDLPHGNIFLSPLTAEAAAEFEVGRLTEISFALVKS